MNWRFVAAATLVAVMLTSFSAEAAFFSRLGGQAYYDDQLGITWATDTNLIGFGTWGTRTDGMSTLMIDGVSGWRLPDMDVNNDGTVVGCGPGNAAACKDNELSYNNWYGGGTGVHFGAPGPFTNMGPFDYWSSTLGSLPGQAYHINMSNGAFAPADMVNIFGGWAVHDGDVNPVSMVDVTYDSPVIDFGPLSFGLTALPAAPNVTFLLNDGTPAGGGATSYGLGNVLSANLIFGDISGPNNLTAFAMEVDAGGTTTALSYAFAPIDSPTAAGSIVLNFPFTVTGTDIASGQAFSYTYDNSTVTLTTVPEPTTFSLLALGLLGIGWRSRKRISLRGLGSA